MFIDIDEPKAPLGVEVMLFPFKKKGEKISPEVCMDVLKSTNYQRSIKDMLNLILELPKEEQAQFKDVVLSTFDNREQPNDILALGQKLAVSGGYEEELATITGNVHEGEWLTSQAVAERWKVYQAPDPERYSCFVDDNIYFLGKSADFHNCHLKNVKKIRFSAGAEVDFDDHGTLPEYSDFSACSKVDLTSCDLSEIKELKFGKDTSVELACVDLPPDLDVSMCSKVDLRGCDLGKIKELKFYDGAEVNLRHAKNLPADLDLSMCSSVDLTHCDLSTVKELKFRDGAKVDLSSVKNLPAILDLSMCSKVDLRYTDLVSVKEVKFAQGSEVNLNDFNHLPANLDVSPCAKVNLQYANLTSVKELKFAPGAEVYLQYAQKVPENTDVSLASVVNMEYADLSAIKEMIFCKGAKVNLSNVDNLPAILDVSMCDDVNLFRSDLTNVQKITFKNEEQMRFSKVELPKNWSGKVEFTDEPVDHNRLNVKVEKVEESHVDEPLEEQKKPNKGLFSALRQKIIKSGR